MYFEQLTHRWNWRSTARRPILDESGAGRLLAGEGEFPMHSFLVAMVFVSMVLAPCILALFTGIDSSEDHIDHGLSQFGRSAVLCEVSEGAIDERA
jgi:hypothetical protein